MGFSHEINQTILINYESCLTNIEEFLNIFNKHFKRHLSYHIKDLEDLRKVIESYQKCQNDVEIWKGGLK